MYKRFLLWISPKKLMKITLLPWKEKKKMKILENQKQIIFWFNFSVLYFDEWWSNFDVPLLYMLVDDHYHKKVKQCYFVHLPVRSIDKENITTKVKFFFIFIQGNRDRILSILNVQYLLVLFYIFVVNQDIHYIFSLQ